MKHHFVLVAYLSAAVLGPGCATDSGQSVTDKVLQDFGLQERPEGYESGSDKVFSRLDELGRADLQRLNTQNRQGEVKFEESDELFGKFYKEVKVYEDFRPVDARRQGGSSQRDSGGYVGIIEYPYTVYQSLRENTRAAAAVADANIRTDIRGRDTIRYKFDRSGNYIGTEGK